MQPKIIVYMATNTINGKRYIGATSKGLEGRKQRHFIDSKRKSRDCPRFYSAIRKYGIDAFEWTTLAIFETLKEMYKEEERLIESLKPEYNIAIGGLIFTSHEKQAKFSAEGAERSRKSVLCLNDGAIHSSAAAAANCYGMERHTIGDLCRRGGIARNGLSFIFYSGPMSESDRNKILTERRDSKEISERARVDKVININSRSVTCLNTGIVYASARAADKANNFTLGTVEYTCRNKKANRSGVCFAFGSLSTEERLKLLKIATDNRKNVDSSWKEKLSKKRSRVVICENTNIIYSNTIEAAEAHDLSFGTIAELCRTGRSTKSGISFSYLDEWCVNSL